MTNGVIDLLIDSLKRSKNHIWRRMNPTVNFINVYARIFRTKFWRQSWNVSRKSCQKGRLYEKFVRKMLMKLTPNYSQSEFTEGKTKFLQFSVLYFALKLYTATCFHSLRNVSLKMWVSHTLDHFKILSPPSTLVLI